MNESFLMAEFKLALRDFLLRRHPDAVDKLELVSLRFSMSRDIGENRYREALRQLLSWSAERSARRASATPSKAEPLDRSLLKVDDLFLVIQVRHGNRFTTIVTRAQMLSEATSNFMKEHCHKEARRSLLLARLVALQTQMTDIPLIFQLSDVCRPR